MESSNMKCYCGKSFQQYNAFSNHQRHCKLSEARLTSALSKTSQIWTKKREAQKLNHAEAGSSVDLGLTLPTIQAPKLFSADAPHNYNADILDPSEPEPPIEFEDNLDLPIAQRRNRREIRLPARFKDALPENLCSLPPYELLSDSTTLELTQRQNPAPITPTSVLESPPNIYGLFRRYRTDHFPSHDPDSDLIPEDLVDITHNDSVIIMDKPTEDTSYRYGPYPNKSSYLLGEWNWDDHIQKSKSSFKSLVNIITDPEFRPADIQDTRWDAIDEELGSSDVVEDGFVDEVPHWIRNDARWTHTPVTISVPFHRYTQNPGPRNYVVPDFFHRSIVSVLHEVLSHSLQGLQFHFQPYELYWQRSNQAAPVRVHGELYSSPAFIDAHQALQALPREPGCTLPRTIAGLMLASDSTQLTSFGDAKIWPLYLYFGNHSKYHRCKPSCRLCYHIAYFKKLPDEFKDFVGSITGEKNLDSNLLTHCNRELLHAQLKIIMDDEFLEVYKHGTVIRCADGLQRRFYLRLFTYSADYPEKAMLATIRNLGTCPCPRCLTPLSLADKFGTPEDQQRRLSAIRVDNHSRQTKVSQARKLIYGRQGATKDTNYGVGSAAVEKLLKDQSLVPTENAFSNRLATFGFDIFPIFVVDLLHEVELGVWRSLFIHLLRILDCIGPTRAHKLDERYRQVPTFGRDTIRKFSSNCSEMKRLAARDFEDLLQCSIPVFEGLLPGEHNDNLLTLLFHLGHWHALAKLRIHTEMTLALMDEVTIALGRSLRDFQEKTCSTYDTRELQREAGARRKRQTKVNKNRKEEQGIPAYSEVSAEAMEVVPTENAGPSHPVLPASKKRKLARPSGDSVPLSGQLSRLKKSLNLCTYKNHSLGDYTDTIRKYGTTDSFSTESGELEHRTPKKWYLRTSRKGFISQLTQIERRQTRIRRIRSHLMNIDRRSVGDSASEPPHNDTLMSDPCARYHIGKTQNNPEYIPLFLEQNQRDPAIKDFLPNLREHLLSRIHNVSDEQNNTTRNWRIIIKGDRIYRHKIVRFNYTTYDVRRAQDTVNPGTLHCNILLLSGKGGATVPDGESPDLIPCRFLYAKVLGIYHTNVICIGSSEVLDYTPQRMDFLWVRWYRHHLVEKPNRLDQLFFPSVSSDKAFGFIDPADVVRGCHIIPRFLKGKRYPSGVGFSRLACDSSDWVAYNVGRFVDRDMLMRYHWGLGIGHIYSWKGEQVSVISPDVREGPSRTQSDGTLDDNTQLDLDLGSSGEDESDSSDHATGSEDANGWEDLENEDLGDDSDSGSNID